MTFNEQVDTFGKKLAMLISAVCCIKTDLLCSKYEEDDVSREDQISFDILIDQSYLKSKDISEQQLDQTLIRFAHEQGGGEWNPTKQLFNYNFLSKMDGDYVAEVIISMSTLNLYQFDENLIKSKLSINKFNL